MINVKKRFGYTKVIAYNDDEKKVLFAYCAGRSFLWRMFLGWRLTTPKDTAIFWIPSHKVEELIEIVESF